MAFPTLAGPQAGVHAPKAGKGARKGNGIIVKGIGSLTSHQLNGITSKSTPVGGRPTSSQPSSSSPTVSPTSSLGKRTLTEYTSSQPTASQPPPARRPRRSSISDSEVERELPLVDESPPSGAVPLAGSSRSGGRVVAEEKQGTSVGKGITILKGETQEQDVWVIDSDSEAGEDAPAAYKTAPAVNGVPIVVSDDDSLPDDPLDDYTPRATVRIRKTTGAARKFPGSKPKPVAKRSPAPDVDMLSGDSDIVFLDDDEALPTPSPVKTLPRHFETPEAEPTPPRSSLRPSLSNAGTPRPCTNGQAVKADDLPPKRRRIPIIWMEPEDETVPSATQSAYGVRGGSNKSGAHSVREAAVPVEIGLYVPSNRPRSTPVPPTSDAPRSSLHSTPVTITQYTSPNKKPNSLLTQIATLLPSRAVAGPSTPQPRLSQGRQKTSTTGLKASTTISRSKSDPSPAPPVYKKTSRPTGERAVMQAAWDAELQKTRAAKVFIVGKFYSDRSSVPDVPRGFTYLESEYFYAMQTIDQNPHTRFLPRSFEHVCWQDNEHCTIRPPRRDGWHECHKQQKNYKGQFAYDEQGLFTFQFPEHVVIQECNRYCLCDKEQCQFSVAQRTRKHELEVFETESCGWGVRTAQDLKRGEVLGMYMGEFITREEAGKRQGNYVFDLDAEERREDLSLAGKFSVDAENCGNWTRFINNSCDPNLIVRTVNFDAPAKQHPGRLIFICNRDIEAEEELSFTYTPTHAVSAEDIEMKPRCRCGADNCRGWY